MINKVTPSVALLTKAPFDCLSSEGPSPLGYTLLVIAWYVISISFGTIFLK